MNARILVAVISSGLMAFGTGTLQTAHGAGANGPNSTSPEITLQQVHMVETRAGTKLWEVRADRVDVHEREGVTILSRMSRPIEVIFYSTEGRLTCVANRATVDLKTKDMRLEGEVFARSDQGTELRTEALQWLAAPRRVQTDQPVWISRGNLVSQGRGLEAETSLERVRIFRNITSQVGPLTSGARRSRTP
jgi:LPS export ABC transporter protein LptC